MHSGIKVSDQDGQERRGRTHTCFQRHITQSNEGISQLELNLLVRIALELSLVDGLCEFEDFPSSIKVIFRLSVLIFALGFAFFFVLVVERGVQEVNGRVISIFRVAGE